MCLVLLLPATCSWFPYAFHLCTYKYLHSDVPKGGVNIFIPEFRSLNLDESIVGNRDVSKKINQELNGKECRSC